MQSNAMKTRHERRTDMNPEQKNGIEGFRVFSRYVVIIVALKLMLLGEAS